MRNWLKIIAATGISTLLAGVTVAQEPDYFRRDRYESVRERYQEQFDPEPVRLGAFFARADLQVGAESNDNVFADETNEQDDIVVLVSPTVDLYSNWSRHEVGARLDVDHFEYSDLDTETVTNVRGQLRGRLDVGRDFFIRADLLAADENEERTSAASLDQFQDPIAFQQLGARTELRYERSRLRAQLFGEIFETEFDPVDLIGGGSEAQDFRDNTESRIRTRLSVAATPDVAFFAQAEAVMRDYDVLSQIGTELASRDSEGYAVLAGVNFELAALLRGDLAVGYQENTPDSDVFSESSGVAVDGRLFWFPTRLTTVEINASRGARDPGIVRVNNATATEFGARVDHELLRNVILFASANLFDQEFEGIDRTDETWSVRLGATYKINKHFHLDGYVSRVDRSSTLPVNEFEQNVIGLALRVFP